jgi:hypothetical protein
LKCRSSLTETPANEWPLCLSPVANEKSVLRSIVYRRANFAELCEQAEQITDGQNHYDNQA